MYSTEDFKLYLSEIGLSEVTVHSYMRDASRFCDHLKRHQIDHISQVQKKNIEFYCQQLIEKGHAIVSVQRKRASLKKFFDFLKQSGQVSENPVLGVRLEKTSAKSPRILNEKEIKKLLSEPNQQTAIGIRDKAMLELAWCTGLKVSELVGICLEDVCLPLKTLYLKRGEEMIDIVLDKKNCQYLSDYIHHSRTQLLNENSDCTFFLNAYGTGLSRQGFWKILKKYAHQAKIHCVTPETLRRSFAFQHLDKNEDICRLKEILGHSDINTTKAYLKNRC